VLDTTIRKTNTNDMSPPANNWR